MAPARKAPKKSTKRKTIIVFVLDETGSMMATRQATVSGFDEYVRSLKDRPDAGQLEFTLTRFNSTIGVMTPLSAVPIDRVGGLESIGYEPRDLTPLYDAMGRSINDVERVLAGRKDKPDVLIIVVTDGEENESKEFTRQMIFGLVDAKRKDGWEFGFIGANMDAWEVGGGVGVAAAATANYVANQKGTQDAYAALQNSTQSFLDADTSGGAKRQFKITIENK